MRHVPLIAGRYEPLQLLGAGGMGEVYLADDHLLSRQVALKLLKKHLAEDPDALARFRKEALAAASLSHPNIVRVFDAGEDAAGVPYIAMEHVPGGTIAHLLAREGRRRPSEAARIAAKIALALNEAHGKGIIHRDVKPQNVLLDERGEPKVTDFGIALAATSASAALTRTAMIVGTARYLSPEQAQGVATEKSDLYSLGIVLYEMLTGRVPFDADNPVALALKHVTEHPPSPRELAPGVAPAIEAATLGLLSKRPAERPRNAAVAARMLFDAADRVDAPSAGSEPTARIASARDSRLARRRRRGLAVAGVMSAGLLAVPAALAQPAFVQEAYSGWFGEDAQPVGRVASPAVGPGELAAPVPAPQTPEPADPPPPAPNPVEEQSPPPEPEPPASDPPPQPDVQASQYEAAPAAAPSETPPPSPAPETAQPEAERQTPPAAQQPSSGPADDPAPRPDPSTPQPRQAPEPPAPSQRAAPEPTPQTASPAPQPPVPEDEPAPQANPGRQEAEEHAGRRR